MLVEVRTHGIQSSLEEMEMISNIVSVLCTKISYTKYYAVQNQSCLGLVWMVILDFKCCNKCRV